MNTRRHDHLLPALTLIGLLAVSGCSAVAAEPPASEPSAPHWSYEGADGPAHWGDLAEDFDTCSSGAAQSPIDLPVRSPGGTGQVALDFSGSATGSVTDTGHAMQFTVSEGGSRVTTATSRYELLQLHVHTPSEHTIAGESAAAEFHFVHADSEGALLVVSVLARAGAASAAWQPIVSALEADEEGEFALDLGPLLPPTAVFSAYDGSLTTPPCTEEVEWIVLSTPVELSEQQLDDLAAHHPHNARTVQPLGDRAVTGGTGTRVGD